MDPSRFESITRRVAAAGSRREALTVLAAAVAAPLLLGWPGQEAEAGLPIVHCKPPGKSCDKAQKCCSGRCTKGHCGCAKKGRPCWAPLEGALCCSQRCRSGKCA